MTQKTGIGRRACRFCGRHLETTFVDLGVSPLCQTHIEPEALNRMESFYPLHAYVCGGCFLVQLEEFVAPGDIFSDYAYFSSYSDSWVAHARRYATRMIERFQLGRKSLVMEIASNDGYLLQHFVADGVPVVGVEPASNIAEVARAKGIRTENVFFGVETVGALEAKYGKPALLLGNNVLAHVPDLNGFVEGMRRVLAPNGVITMEFPHLMRLMAENQFDTIYHEHFSYLSFTTVQAVFAAHGLRLFDVEELSTHGGSLRIYGCHDGDASKPNGPAVAELASRERAFGLHKIETYSRFEEQTRATKRSILEFLIRAKNEGKSIAGYGAPGKGNTLLNYCGVRTDFLDYTVDRSPAKQGRYTPGSRIPIYAPERIRETRPDYLFILPWNLETEIVSQTAYIREWGGRWVVPIPRIRVVS
jgi:SAM-dependent methyltransferase